MLLCDSCTDFRLGYGLELIMLPLIFSITNTCHIYPSNERYFTY